VIPSEVTDSLGTKVKVRFYGIDCPETEKSNRRTGRVSKVGQPYGQEAYRALGKGQDQAAVQALNWKRQQSFKPKRSSDLMAYI
jgi:endonuclease YncB( thermonuclease family)